MHSNCNCKWAVVPEVRVMSRSTLMYMGTLRPKERRTNTKQPNFYRLGPRPSYVLSCRCSCAHQPEKTSDWHAQPVLIMRSYTEIDRPLPLPFPVYTGLYIGVLDWSLHSPRPIPDPTPPQPQSPPPLLRGPADSCRQT